LLDPILCNLFVTLGCGKNQGNPAFLLRILDRTLDTFRDLISELDTKVEFFTAETLKDYLLEQTGDVDFIRFCDQLIAQLEEEAKASDEKGKRATAGIR